MTDGHKNQILVYKCQFLSGMMLELVICLTSPDVILGKIKGRQSSEEITIFKSLGIGMEDLASAYIIYNKAKSEGVGSWVDFTGHAKH